MRKICSDNRDSSVGDFDVPKEFERKRLREFLHLLRIDTKGKRLVLDA
jgi:hypothetical protein